jgi:hypothetical protein
VLVDFIRKNIDHDNEEDKDTDDSKITVHVCSLCSLLFLTVKKDDPWIEATDEFGRTRLMRKSQADRISMHQQQIAESVFHFYHLLINIFMCGSILI